jgi:translation initiation factor 1
MKRKFSIGGSAKEGTILLQGNIREKAIEFLKLSGHNAKPSGG